MDWLIDVISREIGFEIFVYIVLPVFFMIVTVSIASYKAGKRHKARMKKLEQEYLKTEP